MEIFKEYSSVFLKTVFIDRLTDFPDHVLEEIQVMVACKHGRKNFLLSEYMAKVSTGIGRTDLAFTFRINASKIMLIAGLLDGNHSFF